MGEYVTYEGRHHPHIGYDPCPGSQDGTALLADQLGAFAGKVDELRAFLEGGRHDIHDAGWAGENRRAFRETMVEFPQLLVRVVGAFTDAEHAVRDWGEELSYFQARSMMLDEDLGNARARLAMAEDAQQAYQAGEDQRQWSREQRAELTRLDDERELALDAVAEVEQRISDLESEYRERAEDVGSRINAAGDEAWGGSLWDAIGDFFDDIGDWIEDSFIGDIARFLAPIAAWISKWGGFVAAGLAALGGAALLVFPPAAPFLLGGAAIVGGVSTAADATLAAAGHAGWGPVGLGMLTFGLGKAAAAASSHVVRMYKASGRGDELVRVKTPLGTYEYLPTMLDAKELHRHELTWRMVRLKGAQAEWSISGYRLGDTVTGMLEDESAPDVEGRYTGYAGTDPWDLPPNTAYLEVEDGELVK